MVDTYREHLDYEDGARYDYLREAFGDRCPRHPHVLRGGGDCGLCMDWVADMDTLDYAAAAGPGSFRLLPGTRADDRKAVMTSLMAKGWTKVTCSGNLVRWA